MGEFRGKLDEIEEISIDNFSGDNLRSTAFFLSHCHIDHMKGLGSPDFHDALLKRDGVYLYCSDITCRILKNDQCYKDLKGKIKALSTSQSYILVVPSFNSARKEICVTLIPAGHCPGSVMFLFELLSGVVLFTGDFRLTAADAKNLSQLHRSDGSVKEINTCYLDATFYDELYPCFPSREESLDKVCNLIKAWLAENKSNEILLITSARYGCEHIFVGIHDIFRMKIHVQDDIFSKYRAVRKIGLAITTKYEETRIHACGKSERCSCRKPGANWKIIRLSCLWYQREHALKGEISQLCPNYTRVCYACHCSQSEIVVFLKYFVPKRVVVCFPPKGKSREEVEKEIHSLLKEGWREGRLDLVDNVCKKRRVAEEEHSDPPVSPLQLTEEWSLTESGDKDCSFSNHLYISPETSSPSENVEARSIDSERSLSFLPQCDTTDPLIACQKDDIEIITLSSDDSS